MSNFIHYNLFDAILTHFVSMKILSVRVLPDLSFDNKSRVKHNIINDDR